MVKKVLPSKGSRLAWLTEEEVGLLRRRDARMGSPEHKETPDGIPVLERSDDDIREQEERARKKTPAAKAAATNYVNSNPGLKKAWAGIQNPKTAQDRKNKEYWEKRGATDAASFGQAHADETSALIAGTYKGGTKIKAGTKTDLIPEQMVISILRQKLMTSIRSLLIKIRTRLNQDTTMRSM